MTSPANHGRSGTTRLWLLAVLALTLVTHARDITSEFLNWDDGALVLENKFINPVSAEHLRQMWTQPIKDLYTPLAYTAWAAAAEAGRVKIPDAHGVVLNPMVFHALNLMLHLACVAIVYNILLQLLPLPGGERAGVGGETSTDGTRSTKQTASEASPETARRSTHERLASHLTSPLRGEGPMLAAIGAAVFAVHPLQVEPVAWISGMNNVLAGVFALACVACYLRFTATRPNARIAWYLAACIAMLLALFSKPTAIVTPMLILPIDAWILRRPWGKIARSILPLAALAIPFVVIGRKSQAALGTFLPPWYQRPLVAVDAIGFYLKKLVYPRPLLIDYGRRPQAVLAPGGFSPVHWIALAVAVALVAILYRRHRWAAACFAIFVGGMALVLGLVPFSFQDYSTVADRYVYLSMLGVSIFVAMALAQFRSAAPRWIAVGIILLLAYCSFKQTAYWKDSIPLAQHTLDHNPTSLAANSVMAYLAQNRGDRVAEEQYYRQGLVSAPDDIELNYNYGTLLLKDRPGEALPHFETLYARGLRDPRVLNNHGLTLMKIGRLPEAIARFNEVIKVDPNHASTHLNLGLCLSAMHQYDEAEKHFRRTLELDPKSQSAADGLAAVQAVRRGGL